MSDLSNPPKFRREERHKAEGQFRKKEHLYRPYELSGDTREFIEKLYVDGYLHGLTDWLDIPEAIEVGHGYPSMYNTPIKAAVLEILNCLDGWDIEAKVSLGREGPPVMYFWTDEPTEVLEAVARMGKPDEISYNQEAEQYPTPKSPHTWYERPYRMIYPFNSKEHHHRKYVTLPNGEEVLAYYKELHDTEKNTKTLIRAWWD